jgi:hypothetical protein
MERTLARVLLLAGASVLVAGCYESRLAPPEAYRDGGAPQGEGGVDQGDGGVSEAGPGDAAAGDAAAGDAAADGGALACGDVAAPYVGPGCSPAVLACAVACSPEDADCVGRCLASEPECLRCVNVTLVVCANAAGCQPAWDTFACCARESPQCEAASGLDLLLCADACEGELVAYDACLQELAGPCLGQLGERCGLGG